MLELVIANDFDKAMPLVNISNFQELKTELTEQMKRYNSLIVTKETIQDAKTFRANLNKLKEAVETRRKDIKNQCMQPYYSVEPQFKELTALIDAPIKAIDSQVKDFDEKTKAEKRESIFQLYEDIVPVHIKEIVPLTKVWNTKWTNVSTSMESIRAEITEVANRISNDLLAIERLEPEYLVAVKMEYSRTLDLGAALKYRDALQTASETQKQSQPAVNPPTKKKPPERSVELQNEPQETEKIYALRLEFQLTMAQANALKAFLADNNITYTKI